MTALNKPIKFNAEICVKIGGKGICRKLIGLSIPASLLSTEKLRKRTSKPAVNKINEARYKLVKEARDKFYGNREHMAKYLGVGERTIYRWLKQMEVLALYD